MKSKDALIKRNSVRRCSSLLQTHHVLLKSQHNFQNKQQNSNPMQKLISIQIEDQKFCKTEFEKLKISQIICAMLAIIGFGCAAIVYDLTYLPKIYDQKQTQADQLMICCSVSTLLLLLAIFWRTFRQLRWEQAKGIYSYQQTIISTQKFKILLLELFLNIIHPIYTTEIFSFEVFNNFWGEDISYTSNGIISILMIVRVYHVIRLLSILSIFRSSRCQRLCRMNGQNANTQFAIKCLVQEMPYRVIFFSMAIGVGIFAYCLRVAERPSVQFYPENSIKDFSSFENSVWCVIITMTTVGYGDYFPVTALGRLVGFLACMYGVVIVSLIVVTLSTLLVLDPSQEKSYNIIKRLAFKQDLQEAAANVINSAARYVVKCRKNPDDIQMLEAQASRFRSYLKEFQQVKIKRRVLYQLDSWEDRMEYKLLQMIEDTDEKERLVRDINKYLTKLESL